MALTKEQKKDRLKELEKKLEKQKSAVFVSINGLKNKDLLALRNKLREKSAEITVSKKTLTKLAFSNKKIQLDEKILQGQLGIIFGYDSEIDSAKIAHNFSKENKNLNILGGLLENSCIDKEKVASLALLPSKEELYAKIAYVMNAPLINFMNVCRGTIRDLTTVLSKIKYFKVIF